VVGRVRASRGTQSACKRSRRRPAEPIRDSEFVSRIKSGCTGAIFSFVPQHVESLANRGRPCTRLEEAGRCQSNLLVLISSRIIGEGLDGSGRPPRRIVASLPGTRPHPQPSDTRRSAPTMSGSRVDSSATARSSEEERAALMLNCTLFVITTHPSRPPAPQGGGGPLLRFQRRAGPLGAGRAPPRASNA
jgi:hypothetical protein